MLPGRSAKVPAAQLEQLVAPPTEKKPSVHAKQLAELAAPRSVEYAPAGHGAHKSAPSAAANWPAGQSEQLELPTGDTVPTGHSAQVDDAIAPIAAEYVSTGQPAHAPLPLSAAYAPALHATQRLAPGAAKCPDGHRAQTTCEEAPNAVEAVPAGQLVQLGAA